MTLLQNFGFIIVDLECRSFRLFNVKINCTHNVMLSYLSLPDIFYLGVYSPLNGGCEVYFEEYSSAILDIKNCNSSTINEFADCIARNLGNDFDCIVVVPPHDSGSNNSGIKRLAQEIANKNKLVDGTSCLSRHKSINKIATGGSRNQETHLKSIKVVSEEIIKGKKILLFDDISTTGNSLKACQDLLKSAGAETVKCFVLGKTIRSEEDINFFDNQYHNIKKNIEKYVLNCYSDLASKDEVEYQELEAKYKDEMQDLQDNYDEGNLSDEDFEQFACELEGKYSEDDFKVYCESEEYKKIIRGEAGWEEKALNNLYDFSGLDYDPNPWEY